MKIWMIMFCELGGSAAEYLVHDRDQGPLVFADAAYAQAVDAFLALCNRRFQSYSTRVIDGFGPDVHAYLVADDGDDTIELRPYDVIGG